MGFYIQRSNDDVKHKAEWLVDVYEGIVVQKPTSFNDIPQNKGLVIVIDNGIFEAAGYIFDEREFKAATSDRLDIRPKVFVLLDKKLAEKISGYTAAMEEKQH